MSKDPSHKADGLRAMREASRGHLQATAPTLIPYAGKDRTIPDSKTPKPPPGKRKRKP